MRLFAAIEVGPEVRASASAARRIVEARLPISPESAPRIVWMAPQALHVTLRFFGEQPPDRVPAIVEAVREPFPLAPFVVEWRGLGAFPSPRRPRALWMGVTSGARELGELERILAKRFGPLDLEPEGQPFRPHLTLGRIKVQGSGIDWPALLDEAAVTAVRSTVDHVTLVRSRGLAGGAGYEPLVSGRLEG